MRVLVACEYSGVVRDAFKARGHDAWSCDILQSDTPGNHIQGNVLDVLCDGWDLMIAHPPCTYLSYAGVRWFNSQPERINYARGAFGFFLCLLNAPISRIAIENPRGLISQWYKRADQIIQPWQFGHAATKETHLWLTNLPPLMYTQIHINPVKNWTEKNRRSAKERSKTFDGIGAAMAQQWGTK